MADESKYDRWITILDGIYARAEELKRDRKAQNMPEIAESGFDFEKIAFERLKTRLEQSKINIREYYRLCGLLYSLRKSEARQLLKALTVRFPITTDYKSVWLTR
ncbi:MAG: hypothetical protein NTX79_05785 [Candidatus Micrarchaeota archaeon]|nr:hypothetical protein [Candidatus Micrarchaeota archaeon]